NSCERRLPHGYLADPLKLFLKIFVFFVPSWCNYLYTEICLPRKPDVYWGNHKEAIRKGAGEECAMESWFLIILVPVAYLIGALPSGLIMGRAHGVDLRQHGSGKIGATNVSRVVGRRAALVVFVADAVKGAVPVLIARLIPWHDSNLEAIALGLTG